MSLKQENNIVIGVYPHLGPGETVLAYLFASARGHQQARSGGIAGSFGASRAARAIQDAAQAGIELASPMALVLTPSRMLTVQIGNAGRVKRLLNQFDLADVGVLSVRRVGLGASVTVELREIEVRLESRVRAARRFSDALVRAAAARADAQAASTSTHSRLRSE